eukprot:1988155-Prymnesium_polylepis.1
MASSVSRSGSASDGACCSSVREAKAAPHRFALASRGEGTALASPPKYGAHSRRSSAVISSAAAAACAAGGSVVVSDGQWRVATGGTGTQMGVGW